MGGLMALSHPIQGSRDKSLRHFFKLCKGPLLDLGFELHPEAARSLSSVKIIVGLADMFEKELDQVRVLKETFGINCFGLGEKGKENDVILEMESLDMTRPEFIVCLGEECGNYVQKSRFNANGDSFVKQLNFGLSDDTDFFRFHSGGCILQREDSVKVLVEALECLKTEEKKCAIM
jgi:hypothetical protein